MNNILKVLVLRGIFTTGQQKRNSYVMCDAYEKKKKKEANWGSVAGFLVLVGCLGRSVIMS